MHCLIAYSFLADTITQSDLLPKWLALGIRGAWPILLLAFGLGMLIFVHELGHFLAAKLVGIKVEVFSLGFGQRLLGFKRGETDYRISAVPLGGYIKMLGQDDLDPSKQVDDERAFCNKSVGKRFVVIAAGVVMNIICALALFVILFRFTGVDFLKPEVGGIIPNCPAEKAGLLPGDTILTVNGKKIRDFNELTLRIALSQRRQDVHLQVERPGQREPLLLTVRPEYLESDAPVPGIGVYSAQSLIVEKSGDYSGEEGLIKGDVIVGLKYGGKRHYYDKHYQFAEEVNSRRDKPTAILAVRSGQELEPIIVCPRLAAGSQVLGLIPPTQIASVEKDSAASKAGLKPGDVIVSFDNQPWPSNAAISEIAKAAKNQLIPITVLRAGEKLDRQIKLPRKRRKGVWDTACHAAHQELYVAGLAKESLLAEQKIEIPVGAKLLKLNGRRLANWSDLIGKLQGRMGKKAKLEYLFDGSKNKVSFVVPSAQSPVWKQEWRFFVSLVLKPEETTVKGESLTEAIYIGLHKTWFWMQNIYLTLTRLAQGSVKTDALAGPLGIARLSMQVALLRGPTHFFYLMAIIGVNLAIVNFLPIPILDGGHALFLLLEKIKGSPVSMRVQTVATTIGLAAIAALFMLLTYQDIMSWWRG